jgi:hypothetical protein
MTTTNLIELLTDAKKNNIGIGECWNLMDEAADLLEAQAKQIEELQAYAASEKTASLEKSKQIEELQAYAERYRVGREAAFAGLLVDFPHTKTWSDAMDFAYDQMIASRKGNV